MTRTLVVREHETDAVTKRGELPDGLTPAFRVADALASGVSKKRLRAHDLPAPFHGMRSTLAPQSEGDYYMQLAANLRKLAREFMVVAPAHFAFSHVTAARIHGIPLPSQLLVRQGLDVATLGFEVRRAGIRGHTVSSLDAQVVDGLPVLGPEAVWLQLAGMLTIEELIVAGDHLVRRKRQLSSMEKINAAIYASAGNRGVRAAAAAFMRVRPGTDSPPESRLRLLIVAAGLPEPRVRYQAHDDDGYWVGTPDLAYPDRKVAIEYQGGGHRDEEVYEDDIQRLERFHDAGWTVIQVTKGQMRDPRGITERVRLALAEGSTRR